MKRLVFFCLATLISLISIAQDGGVYLKGGVNFANVTQTSQGEANDANMLLSFHVGFTGDLAIASIFSIQPSLLLMDTRTMRSKLFRNLFITGDLLHINRPSGGFSFQLCWTTGFVAGSHV